MRLTCCQFPSFEAHSLGRLRPVHLVVIHVEVAPSDPTASFRSRPGTHEFQFPSLNRHRLDFLGEPLSSHVQTPLDRAKRSVELVAHLH